MKEPYGAVCAKTSGGPAWSSTAKTSSNEPIIHVTKKDTIFSGCPSSLNDESLEYIYL